ncbi:hypothetical protein HLB44_24755 [Aquincola sp. S2]|uniref:Beta-1,3-glucanase N-terminal domain-containing protein n=1 Tax=Pseudaquabacterium terrae TaxID=2732868 RepID=A0ABX2ENS6_9BURK|nr:hypothetical protein [Aquabacterium terrae]NRF70222.1 hypothetical protein [Aquabacterium terrae]
MTRHHICVAALFALASAAGSAQVISFDAATGVVTIPSVSVGASTYRNVTLKADANFVFSVTGATLQVPATPGVASYAGGLLTLPAVQVGSQTYLDVTLLDAGNLTFTLQAATPLPAATLDAVNALFAASDAMFATAVPGTGALRMSLNDGCWRDDGRTKANFIADWDANAAKYAQRDAYHIGRTRSNVQVLALRNRSNSDGSQRQEIDVQYDLGYTDGTRAVGLVTTLISGSSAGTPGCTTPQSSATLRGFGNQQVLRAEVRSRNVREQRQAIASGAALSPAVNYRRSVQWGIEDPMGNATYVIVTGPGPAATVNGVATQFSLKFLSPRVLRSAPELLGKPGNFVNWLDEDGFRYCRAATNPAVAAIADCTGMGATAFDYGHTTSVPNAANDATFDGQGWSTGSVFRFDVYNDDGWKTVNGHAGRAPIASYYDTLTTLPYSFVEMAGSGTGADKFPRLNFGALSTAQVASNVISATPVPMSVSWNAASAVSSGRASGVFQGWEFHQGPKVGNAAGATNPAYRNIFYNFPGSMATSNAAWSVTAKPADQASKTYGEFSILYSDRGDNNIISIVSFQ